MGERIEAVVSTRKTSTHCSVRPDASRNSGNLITVNCSAGISNRSRKVLPLTLCSVNARSVKSKSADFRCTTMTSFEYAEFIVKSGSFSTRLVIVYHPPYSREHPHTDRSFLTEFTTYLESIILSVESLLIVGDFNLHVDDPDDAVFAAFLDTLESMNLAQHVTGPTHEHNHTLDLVITRQSDKVLLCQPKVGFLFSDHAPIFCSLNSIKPQFSSKSYTYRKSKQWVLWHLRRISQSPPSAMTTSHIWTTWLIAIILHYRR